MHAARFTWAGQQTEWKRRYSHRKYLHSKTTRKKLRTHAIDKYRHANTAEGACVSLFYMRVHTHTHNYCSSILADALGLAKCIHWMHAITAEGYVCVCVCVYVAAKGCVCAHGKGGRRKEMNAKWGQKENSAEHESGGKTERWRKGEGNALQRWGRRRKDGSCWFFCSFLRFKTFCRGDLGQFPASSCIISTNIPDKTILVILVYSNRCSNRNRICRLPFYSP